MAKYGTLSNAIANGLFHPNCKHSVSIYVEGISTKPAKPSKEDLAREKALYEAKQHLNYINRMIVQWKNRVSVSFIDKDIKLSKAKLQEWYAIRREFRAEWPDA